MSTTAPQIVAESTNTAVMLAVMIVAVLVVIVFISVVGKGFAISI